MGQQVPGNVNKLFLKRFQYMQQRQEDWKTSLLMCEP